MKLLTHKELKFYARPGSSDEKTFNEVIVKKAYLKTYFKIEEGEEWLDLGGNVGAFTLLAAQMKASVTTYEPDPANVKLIKANLELNNLRAQVISRAIIHNDTVALNLNLWPDGQSWRNSLVRNKKGTQPITVLCDNFFKVAKPHHCVKMDIEGAEIKLLEAWPEGFKVKKLVFEYSFDVDPSVVRLRKIIAKLKSNFPNIKYSSQIDKIEEWKFFPPATMIHCF